MKILYALIPSVLMMLSLMVTMGCKDAKKNKVNSETQLMEKSLSITKSNYGTTADGKSVDNYLLENEGGIQVEIITYGGRITSLKSPDKHGNIENVVLGFNDIAQYEKGNPYFGALVGRYGNRIANGTFSLDGKEYALAQNNGKNNLHGGILGFDKKVWDATVEESDDSVALKLTYLSEDMEEGFPGNLTTMVTYTLKRDNSLDVVYEAVTDKATVVNLTQHAYFNLSGDFSEPILDHVIEIDADRYLPVDSGLIPTGELASVADTPFDFRKPKPIGEDINANHKQIELGGGYDHCWVLNNENTGYSSIASTYHPETGRFLEVLTNEPGVQFYTANFLDGTLPAPNGGTYGKRSGFCLETQHFPDSPNQPDFPSVTVRPGEKYLTRTTFIISVK
jgi:aldose 1-epimerase